MKAKVQSPKVAAKPENVMRAPYIEKVIISAGATGDDLIKARKLLELLSKKKAQIVQSNKRIPDFGVRPGLEVGTRITLRRKDAIDLLKRLLGAMDNALRKKQISENHFSFGLEEYIEIPGIEYQRDIGIRGLNVTIVFARKGLRVGVKKIKSGKVPKKQRVSKEEIITYMEENFKTKFN
ncbi:MAG: 50S ribosomal protein L5 [Nanoarchaeota archaeon]|nr:50S ribosomal protein L5 [Nanoarchaeota archaeon]